MKLVLRADAGLDQGAGHVMRSMAIAETARDRGHEVEFVSALGDIHWLRRRAQQSGIPFIDCEPDTLDVDHMRSLQADWVIVDSYAISAQSISELSGSVSCVAIIDGDHREISAQLFVDSNLDAENRDWPESIRPRLLAGADYAVVRKAIRAQRRSTPWATRKPRPEVVAFMGGTDPYNAISHVAGALIDEPLDASITLVVTERNHGDVVQLVAGREGFTVIGATEDLPGILGRADVMVSAAGTSAWDLCTLGVPSVLIALADNQSAGLQAALRRGLVLGWDSMGNLESLATRLRPELNRLLADESLRRQLSERSLATFDGRGTERIIEALETR